MPISVLRSSARLQADGELNNPKRPREQAGGKKSMNFIFTFVSIVLSAAWAKGNKGSHVTIIFGLAILKILPTSVGVSKGLTGTKVTPTPDKVKV